MENNRNIILAIVLSMAVLFGWQFFVAGPQMELDAFGGAPRLHGEADSVADVGEAGRRDAEPTQSIHQLLPYPEQRYNRFC